MVTIAGGGPLTPMRRATFLSVPIAAALVAAACGGGATPRGAATDAPRTVQIGISDFFFSPALLTLRSGETVKVLLKNAGTQEHTFMAARGPELGKGFSQDWLAPAMSMTAGHDMASAGPDVRVAPGTTTTLTLVVPADAGEFEFGCFLPGHYESGMKGKVLVESGTAGASAAPNATGAPSQTARPTATPMGSMGEEDAETH